MTFSFSWVADHFSLIILKRNMTNKCLLFMPLYSFYCSRKTGSGLEKMEALQYCFVISRWTKIKSLHRQTSDYIKTLLESGGKDFLSQSVPFELHLALCHVCLLRCASPLCPSVGAGLWEGRTQRQEYLARTCRTAGPCASLPLPPHPPLQLQNLSAPTPFWSHLTWRLRTGVIGKKSEMREGEGATRGGGAV